MSNDSTTPVLYSSRPRGAVRTRAARAGNGAPPKILRRVIADVALVTQLRCPQIPGETSAQFARRIHQRLHSMAGDLYTLSEELSPIIDRG